jgi:hypothetical protein
MRRTYDVFAARGFHLPSHLAADRHTIHSECFSQQLLALVDTFLVLTIHGGQQLSFATHFRPQLILTILDQHRVSPPMATPIPKVVIPTNVSIQLAKLRVVHEPVGRVRFTASHKHPFVHQLFHLQFQEITKLPSCDMVIALPLKRRSHPSIHQPCVDTNWNSPWSMTFNPLHHSRVHG